MRVLYVWEKAQIKESGIGSHVLKAYSCILAPDCWINLDHYRAAPVIDCFCLSANTAEIKKYILPRIANHQHKSMCIQPFLSDKVPGMPFFVTRDFQYIQRITKLPWKLVGDNAVAMPPFYETNVQINCPDALLPLRLPPTGYGIPGYGPPPIHHVK